MTLVFRPLGGMISVLRDAPIDKTKLGIHIPDSGQKKPSTGKVLECGKGLYVHAASADGQIFFAREPIEIEPGMKIVFLTYAGVEVQDQGGPAGDRRVVTVIPAKDVLGLMEESSDVQ